MRNGLYAAAVFSLVFHCLFVSCGGSASADPGYSVPIGPFIFPRISVFSQDSPNAEATVEIEDNSGRLINGAVVLLYNTANSVKRLEYDNSTGYFRGNYPIPEDGKLFFSIKSKMAGETLTYQINHRQIFSKPSITILEDSEGNSAMHGLQIDPRLNIQIAWTSSGEDIIYQVLVKDVVNLLYETSTESLNVFIPSGTLRVQTGTTYNVQIIAQRIYGDPFLIRENYYSASLLSGTRVNFSVK
ncbi:MAG: hypothetical protein LBK27_06255 [Treponema sp.]|jgi:hypothetical protein|nr:hypothetical protein [Treponema sp.]